MSSELQPLVIVIGAARSGTTVLGRILGEVPGFVAMNEHKYLWRIGSAYKNHDARTASEATPKTIKRIHNYCKAFQNKNGGNRIVEKTPPNCFRVEFIHKVFPDAVFIHIIRNGTESILSRVNMIESERRFPITSLRWWLRMPKRILAPLPWWEKPSLLIPFLRGVRNKLPGAKRVWGENYPGWNKDKGTLSPLQFAAKSWAESVRAARQGLTAVPENQRIEIRYEELIHNHENFLNQIAQLCKMSDDQSSQLLRIGTEELNSKGVSKWSSNYTNSDKAEIAPFVEELLLELGYKSVHAEPQTVQQ
ncbi:MAG: sulfotransferase [Planctomycetota bacterium]